ncbi:MAG: MFS transporter, partial [Acidimicrobiaceae bacterium]|nr:MFS transporter [Acidimicrobiaceae bacterium]
VFMASYLLSAGSVWPAAVMAGRVGSVSTIVLTRIIAAGLMVATALSPTFLIAVVFQILRTAATMMATPVRQSFTMGLFPSEERASASGFTGVVRRLAASASPPIAGGLFENGYLEIPFFLGAGFQILSAILYSRFFGHIEPHIPKVHIIESENPEVADTFSDDETS